MASLSPIFAQFSANYKKKNPQSFSSESVKPDYSFLIGTQVGTSFNHSSWVNSYFAPSASIDLTSKLSIQAGIGVSVTQLYHIPYYSELNGLTKSNGAMTSMFAYASGIYKLNSKVNLNATALMEKNYLNFNQNNATIENRFNEMSVGLNYNVTPHFSFNAQVGFSNRPTYMNPYFSSGLYPGSSFGFPAY